MSEHYDFHYQPTGSGAISGQQVLEQTEDAINELGDYVYDNVGGAMDVAQQALETAQNAEQDAQTALDTANSFSSAIQSAQQDASTALSTAQTAQTTASNANNTAIQAQQDASSAVTTANNASGQVSTLSGTVTALGQRVTTAEGNIGQNTSDITALTTRVGTAEGNITTLQNDVSIAQGNASSAMATAGQVKQQAFVFRYSSTALVASSTNSNTLLDNTDNLKVGDKVIDSSGVLFSVTAIDTQNSTFTIGTALIDLAQDSDVVHKSGNETVGGVKTFSDNLLIGNNNTNITISNRQITANSSYSAPTGSSYSFMQLKAKVNYADSSSPIDGTVVLEINEDAFTDGSRSAFSPNSNNVTNLGKSGKRWANVYATNYYYGGSEIEFSQKFVTTDTNQTISGNKTFSDNLTIYNSDDTQTPKGLTIRNAQWGVGESGGITASNINFLDKNSAIPASIIASKGVSGQSFLRFSVRTKDSQNTNYGEEIYYDIDTSGNVEFRSWHDNTISLGTSIYKWKGVYATNYYYGSNNVEFSTKFVTTDTNQTITGNKTFSSNVNVYNSDSTGNVSNIVLKNSKAEVGTEFAEQSINFVDKNNNPLAKINCYGSSGNFTRLYITAYDANNNSEGFYIRKSPTGISILPTTAAAVRIGNDTFPYLNVQTRRVNDLEPSSLSLPSGNANDVIDISSYITDLSGNINNYTAPVNGWIAITLSGCSGVQAYIIGLWGHQVIRPTVGGVRFFMPVTKSLTVNILIFGGTIDNARFIPCQGNV